MASGSQNGVSNNPKGRPRGSNSKQIAALRSMVMSLLEDGEERFKEALDNMNDTEYTRIYIQLMSFTVPKPIAQSPSEMLRAEREMFEKMLIDAPSRAVELISNRLYELQNAG